MTKNEDILVGIIHDILWMAARYAILETNAHILYNCIYLLGMLYPDFTLEEDIVITENKKHPLYYLFLRRQTLGYLLEEDFVKIEGKYYRKTLYYSKTEKREKVTSREYIKTKCTNCKNECFQAKRVATKAFCSRECRWMAENNPQWNGGKCDSGKYILIYVPDNPMATKQGYVREHRLIMANYLGRSLENTEVVHHVNGKTKDNRIENLVLYNSSKEHVALHNTLLAKNQLEIKCLLNIIKTLLPLAAKYAHGRNTYSPHVVRTAVEDLKRMYPTFEVKKIPEIQVPTPEELQIGCVLRGDYLDDIFSETKEDDCNG